MAALSERGVRGECGDRGGSAAESEGASCREQLRRAAGGGFEPGASITGAVLVAMLAVAPAAWARSRPHRGHGARRRVGRLAGSSSGRRRHAGNRRRHAGPERPTAGQLRRRAGARRPAGQLRRRPRQSARPGAGCGGRPGSLGGQKADATASADQKDVDNTAVTVRVDEPGNGKKVGQENRASADADASTTSAVEGPGEVTVVQGARRCGERDADRRREHFDRRQGRQRGGRRGRLAGERRDGRRGRDDALRPAVGRDGRCRARRHTGRRGEHDRFRSGLLAGRRWVGEPAQRRLRGGRHIAGWNLERGRTAGAAQNTSVSIRVDSPGSAATPAQANRVDHDLAGRRRRGFERQRRRRDGGRCDQHRAHGRGRRDGARSPRLGRLAGLGVDLGVAARRDAGPRRPGGGGARLVELGLGRNGERHDGAAREASPPAPPTTTSRDAKALSTGAGTGRGTACRAGRGTGTGS